MIDYSFLKEKNVLCDTLVILDTTSNTSLPPSSIL